MHVCLVFNSIRVHTYEFCNRLADDEITDRVTIIVSCVLAVIRLSVFCVCHRSVIGKFMVCDCGISMAYSLFPVLLFDIETYLYYYFVSSFEIHGQYL